MEIPKYIDLYRKDLQLKNYANNLISNIQSPLNNILL